MKRLFLLTSLFICLFKTAHSQADMLDPSFGNNGIVTTKSSNAQTIFTSSAAQQDEKIVTTGFKIDGPNYTFFVARYKTNGNADSSFSSYGIATTGITFPYNPLVYPHNIYNNNKGTTAAIAANGKIVVTADSVILRYNADGSVDNTFSADGKQKAGFEIFAMNVQSDGKIVAGGPTYIVRYNSDGSLDNSFNGTGVLTTSINVVALAIQGDGKIVAGGTSDGEPALARFNNDGFEDATFYVSGIHWVNSDEPTDSYITAVSIQADGKIIIAGYGGTSERYYINNNTLMARFNTDGSLDRTFSDDGVTQIFADAKSALLQLQSDGKIIVGSNLYDNIECGEDCVEQAPNGFAIARLSNDGRPDSSFNKNGSIYSTYKIIFLPSIAVSGDKLYAVGYGKDSVYDYGFIEKYLLNGNNTSPTVSLTSPGSATYTGPINIKLAAAASDADGTVTKVEFYNNSTLLHTETTAPYGFLWKNVPAGTYTLTAKATDNFGAQTTSAPVKVIVNASPMVSLTSPASRVYTGPLNIKLAADAIDSDGTITKVEFYNGSTLLRTETVAPYGFLWRNVPAGTYTLTARATDNLGAQTTSAPVKVTVNKAPIVSLTTPANHAAYAAPATLKLSAAASDVDGTITKVEFFNGGILLHTETVAPYGYLWKGVPTGTYALTAKATDNLGAQTTSVADTITVSSTGAIMVSNRPNAKNEKVSQNDALLMSLYPNPATNVVNIYTKGLQQDKPATISVISALGVTMKVIGVNTSAQTISVNVSSLAKGIYTIKITSGNNIFYRQFVKM